MQDNNKIIEPIVKWFKLIYALEVSEADDEFNADFTAQSIQETDIIKKDVLKLLKIADPSIVGIEVDGPLKKVADSHASIGRVYDVKFVQEHKSEMFKIPFSHQSRGVQRMFSIAFILNAALVLGGVVLIDELEASMHPHLARYIVDLFQNKETNTKGAQIIFTTHDTNLLDQSLLRRDQIWFVEKDGCCSTLYGLLEFAPRKDENLESGYLRGRYGGVPSMGAASSWLHSVKDRDAPT